MQNTSEPRNGKNMIACVILAAGRSERLGVPKLALPLCGKSLLAWTIDGALASAAGRVFVVVQPDHRGLQPDMEGRSVTVVVNEDAECGLSSSIRAGVRAAAGAAAIVILPGDQPFAGQPLIDALIREYRLFEAPAIGCDFRSHQGPPALFDSSLFPRLLSLQGDVGARGLLRTDSRTRYVLVDSPLAGVDVDTYDDYLALREAVAHIAHPCPSTSFEEARKL